MSTYVYSVLPLFAPVYSYLPIYRRLSISGQFYLFLLVFTYV